jgi:hypothetical protein
MGVAYRGAEFVIRIPENRKSRHALELANVKCFSFNRYFKELSWRLLALIALRGHILLYAICK